MNIPENLKYTRDHEWIKVDGNTAFIGVTDYAQSELGDIVYVDIDSDLEEIVKGETFGSIEAVKTVSDLYAPCSGRILEINPKLEDDYAIINSDPYDNGWLIKVELSNISDLDELLDASAYGELIGQ